MTEGVAKAANPPRWRRVALTLLLVKLAYWVCVAGLVWWGEGFDTATAERIRQRWFPPEAPPPVHGRWERHFATWDAEHYLYLATHGYGPEVRSVAFYPLWPLVLRGATAVTGLGSVLGGLLLANLFSLAGWTLFHRVTAGRFGESLADVALALLVSFPGALFFQFIYSEALFFLLLMVLWWGLERRRDGWAFAAGLLLPLARGVGVFAVLPVAWHVAATARAGRKGKEPAEDRNPKSAARRWLLPVAPLAGWGVYLALMWVWTGNAWAGIEAQRYWGVHSISNLWDVLKFVNGLFEVSAWHAFTGSALDRLGFVLLLYAVPMLWGPGKDLLVWLLVLGVVPAMSGTFVSFVRFESCAFPVFLGWAAFFTGLKWRWPLGVFLAVNLALHGHLLWRFLNYRWAG